MIFLPFLQDHRWYVSFDSSLPMMCSAVFTTLWRTLQLRAEQYHNMMQPVRMLLKVHLLKFMQMSGAKPNFPYSRQEEWAFASLLSAPPCWCGATVVVWIRSWGPAKASAPATCKWMFLPPCLFFMVYDRLHFVSSERERERGGGYCPGTMLPGQWAHLCRLPHPRLT